MGVGGRGYGGVCVCVRKRERGRERGKSSGGVRKKPREEGGVGKRGVGVYNQKRGECWRWGD